MLKQHLPSYLVLKHWSTKGPDGSKDKVKFIKLLGTVRRCVLLRQEAFEEVAQHLNHTLLRNGNNLLKSKGWKLKAWEIQSGPAPQCFFRILAFYLSAVRVLFPGTAIKRTPVLSLGPAGTGTYRSNNGNQKFQAF